MLTKQYDNIVWGLYYLTLVIPSLEAYVTMSLCYEWNVYTSTRSLTEFERASNLCLYLYVLGLLKTVYVYYDQGLEIYSHCLSFMINSLYHQSFLMIHNPFKKNEAFIALL